jgi:hypothetical protein
LFPVLPENTKVKITDGTHDRNIKKYIYESSCLFVNVMGWHSTQYPESNIKDLPCLFFNVFALDSGHGFSDKYAQQLVVTLEILSI